MKLTLFHLRHTAVAAITCFLVLAAIWWVLWMVAASQYRHVIEGWIDAGRADGDEITYDQNQLFGFPHHVVLRFTNVLWKTNDHIVFHADDIDVGAIPWQWQHFTAKFKKHVEIDAPVDEAGTALVLAGEDGRADVELDPQGYWLLTHIALSQAKLGQSPHFLITADALKASAERPLRLPKDHTETGLTLNGTATNVTLPEALPTPFGNQMTKLDVSLRVMGMVPDFRRRDSVDAWNKESGIVEFDRLNMDWGPLKLTSKGTMGLDDDLQPEGAFVGSLVNHEDVLKALMEHDYIAKRQEAMMTSALSLFSKPAQFSAEHGIELPIAIQLGGLFLGPVKIFSFPQIEWPQGLPAATPPAPNGPVTP